MQNYFETDYATIMYDRINDAILLKWKVTPTHAEFREGLNSLITAMEYFKTGKLVTDTTHMGAIHPDNQKWAATEWFQKAIKAGYSHIAIIVPTNVFTQISVEDTMNQVDNPFPSASFDDIVNAMDWIKRF